MKKVSLKSSRNNPRIPKASTNGEHARTEPVPVIPEPITPEVPVYDELLSFALAYKSGVIHVPIFPSQLDGVQMLDGISTFTVYQSGKFKIELSLFRADTGIVEFKNPTTDMLIAHIAGNISYTKNGEGVIFGTGDYSQPMENGVSKLNGQSFRVTPKDSFGFYCNKAGAMLTFNMRVDGQDWPIAKPS